MSVLSEGGAGGSDSTDSFDALLQRAARLTPWPLAMRLHPGMALCSGRFRVLRRIGEGGMGVVYEAFDQERGGEVAIKTLSRLDANGIYRLKNEFRALSHVVHPNLVRLHDLFAEEGLWLFSMELLHGRPFDAWCRPGGQLDVARLRSGLAQLVAGVSAIHAAGKLHRDLKPSNVLAADSGGRVSILDFGLIADPGWGGRGQTRDSGVSGTPHYMAPEQAGGDPSTTASDWYAVGVMLFESLTGRLPFDGRVLSILQRKQGEAAPRASSLASDVPGDLDELCAALLDRDPALRPDGEALAYVLDARQPPALPVNAALTAQSSALLGREGELLALREAHAAARAGQAVMLSVTGESGIGKTALAEAFLSELAREGHSVVLAGRCYERENVPYKAFDRVVDEITHHLRQLTDVAAASLMPRDIAALTRIFPVLGRAPCVAAQHARAADNATEQRRRAFDAFVELLGRLRDRSMLVVYIDDVHWLDHDSMQLFERLLGDPDPAPFLLMLGHRGSGADGELLSRVARAATQNRRIDAREVSLGPLSGLDALTLVRRLLPRADDSRVQAVVREAHGNPFFVGELTRIAALPHGAISVDRAVQERALGSGDGARALLSVLAVAGHPTPVEVLVQAAGPCDDPHRALDLLRTTHLVRDTGKRRYECYHDRIRAAVSGRLQQAEVRAIHRQLAMAWSTHPDADPEVLVTHWLAAGEREQAAGHAVAAAERASASLAFERSAHFLAHAIEVLPEAEVRSLDLRRRRAEALSLSGRWAEAGSAYREAGAHSTPAAEHDDLVLRSAVHFLGSGHGDQGLPLLRQVFESTGVRWPRTRAGAVTSAIARFAWLWLRSANARARRARAREKLRATTGSFERSDFLARWLAAAGLLPAYDLARGLYFMSVFASLALRSGDDGYAGMALGMLASLFAASRHTKARARSFGERACTLARGHADAALASATLAFVAYAQLLDGRPDRVLALGVEAEQRVAGTSESSPLATWTARAAQAYGLLALGRVGEAARVFEDNARVALESGNDMVLVGGACAIGYLVTDDTAGADALLERKERVLAKTPARGMLRELVKSERVFCALYRGEGAALVAQERRRSDLLALFDPGMPLACAALQADPAGKAPGTRRLLRRAIARLRSQGNTAGEAMTLQLTAAIRFMDGEREAAASALDAAAQQYDEAHMALHAVLMRQRAGELRSQPEATEHARRFMQAQGIARPELWAGMLAPGFTA